MRSSTFPADLTGNDSKSIKEAQPAPSPARCPCHGHSQPWDREQNTPGSSTDQRDTELCFFKEMDRNVLRMNCPNSREWGLSRAVLYIHHLPQNLYFHLFLLDSEIGNVAEQRAVE